MAFQHRDRIRDIRLDANHRELLRCFATHLLDNAALQSFSWEADVALHSNQALAPPPKDLNIILPDDSSCNSSDSENMIYISGKSCLSRRDALHQVTYLYSGLNNRWNHIVPLLRQCRNITN
jgi:hypothetical protein